MDPEEIRQLLRAKSRKSLYFLAKAVLGNPDLTPRFHRSLCYTIQDPLHKRKLLEVPRGHLKTTLNTRAKPIWRWIQEADLKGGFYGADETILLVQSSAELASLNLQAVQHVFESNVLFRWLFPELIPEDFQKTIWNTQQMRIGGKQAAGPSMYAFGVGGKMTGLHVRGIIEDDLVDETIAESVLEIQKRIDWHQYAFPLLIEPTKDWMDTIGNRWGRKDVNGWIKDHEPDCFQMHFKAIEDGKPIWPERFPLEELEKIKIKLGPYKFACQYMNDPKDAEMAAFRTDWLRYYQILPEGDLILDDGEIVKQNELFKYMVMDPAATAGARSDRTGIVVTGLDPIGRIFVLEAVGLRKDPYEALEDVYKLYEKWTPSQIGIEQVTFSKILEGGLNRMAADKRKWLPIVPVSGGNSPGAKEARINQVVGETCAAGRTFIRREMGDWLEEYSWFPDPTTTKDILDAFSLSDKLWIVRREDKTKKSAKDEAAEWLQKSRKAGRSRVTGY
jgi:hypothetical protein